MLRVPVTAGKDLRPPSSDAILQESSVREGGGVHRNTSRVSGDSLQSIFRHAGQTGARPICYKPCPRSEGAGKMSHAAGRCSDSFARLGPVDF